MQSEENKKDESASPSKAAESSIKGAAAMQTMRKAEVKRQAGSSRADAGASDKNLGQQPQKYDTLATAGDPGFAAGKVTSRTSASLDQIKESLKSSHPATQKGTEAQVMEPQTKNSDPMSIQKFKCSISKMTDAIANVMQFNLSDKSKEKSAANSAKGSARLNDSPGVLASPTRVKIKPVQVLQEKMDNFEGLWSPMEVFDSLPSMYTQERWQEIQKKNRGSLDFQKLFWLSRYDPKPNDGHLLERIINQKIEMAKDSLNERVNPILPAVSRLATRCQELESQIHSFRGEVASMSKLKAQMLECVENNIENSSKLSNIERRTEELNAKIGNTTLSYARRMNEFDTKLKKFDALIHKPNNFFETLRKETEKIETRLSKKMLELQEEINVVKDNRQKDCSEWQAWQHQAKKVGEINGERLEKMGKNNDMAEKKMQIFERIMSEFNIHIEALKTHALSTDLHLESSLPLQVAGIAYEVGMGSITKKQLSKYRKNFKRRVQVLEQNYQDCSDPFIHDYQSIYIKNQYVLPEEYTNPAMLAHKSSRRNSKSISSSASPSKHGSPQKEIVRRRLPPSSKETMPLPLGRTINEMSNAAARRKTLGPRRLTSDGSVACPPKHARHVEFPVDNPNRFDDLPKSIPRQLLDTLTNWQPVSHRMTIRDLFMAVTKQVTDFLKIPMYEMTSEEFYSLYMDADKKGLELFEPLKGGEEKKGEAEAKLKLDETPRIMRLEPQLMESLVLDQPTKSALKKQTALSRSQVSLRSSLSSGGNSPLKRFNSAYSRQSVDFRKSSESRDGRPLTSRSLKVNNEAVSVTNSEGVPQVRIAEEPTYCAINEASGVPNQFARLRAHGGFQDPKKMAQEARLAKANDLQQKLERRKLQEQVTSAIESMLEKMQLIEKKYQLRFTRLDKRNAEQELEIKRLTGELASQQTLNQSRELRQDEQVNEVNTNIEKTRMNIKKLLGELEESMMEQIKIPQVQLLHTEYQRLKEVEQKGISTLLRRKEEIKAYQQANGGRTPKDDGIGGELRKEQISTRAKLRIVGKKIKKYGELGKIPMGASMRVYHENPDTESSVTSASEDFDEVQTNSSLVGSEEDGSPGAKSPKKKKLTKELLKLNQLVYQPEYRKIVTKSTHNLPNKNSNVDTESQKSVISKDEKLLLKIYNSSDSSEERKQGKPAKAKLKAQQQKKKEQSSDSIGSLGEQESVSQSQKSLRIKEEEIDGFKIRVDKLNTNAKRKDSSSSSSFDARSASRTTAAKQKGAEGLVQPISRNSQVAVTSGITLIPTITERSEHSGHDRPSHKTPSAKFKSSESLNRVVQQIGVINESDEFMMAPRLKSTMPKLKLSSGSLKCVDEASELGAEDREKLSEERRNIKQQQRIASALSYGSRKLGNTIKRDYVQKKKRQMMRDQEVQTENVQIGEVELDLSDDEQQPYYFPSLKNCDQGTDPPKFLILNVLPSRPSDEFFAKRDLRRQAQQPKTKIESIVGQIRTNNARLDIPDPTPNLKALGEKFALLKGEGPSDDVMRISRQNLINQEHYDAYLQLQEGQAFKQMYIEQNGLHDSYGTAQMLAQNSREATAKQYAGGRALKKQPSEARASMISHSSKVPTEKSIKRELSKRMRHGMAKNRDEGEDTPLKTKFKRKRRESDVKNARRVSQNRLSDAAKTPKTPSSPIRHSPTRKEEQQLELPQEFKEKTVQESLQNLQARMHKIDQMNEQKQKQEEELGGSLMNDSSFEVSSDGDDSEDEEFVTTTEFNEYKDTIQKELALVKQSYHSAVTYNMNLVKKLDNVDWSLINKAETKLAEVLMDFQMSVDGLMMAIEADIKRWKSQHTELSAKYEQLQAQMDSIQSTTDYLREEIFSNSEDSWNYQQALTKFCHMQVGLALADEVDKKGISLVGKRDVSDAIKHTKYPDNSVVGLDPNCRQCQCQSVPERAALLQSLKLACLAYQPSGVSVPTLSKSVMSRVDVVGFQQKVTLNLAQIQADRQKRLDKFREELRQLDEAAAEIKAKSPLGSRSPAKYLQTSDEKIFESLNYIQGALGQESGYLRKRNPNMNIMIKKGSKTRVMSPSASSPLPAKFDHAEAQTVLLNEQGGNMKSIQTTTALRKPIIRGKIDSRAILGLKKNLHTASDLTQIVQQQKESREKSISAYKLSHQSAANLGYSIPDSRPGDERYKMISSLQPNDKDSRIKVVFNKTAAQMTKDVSLVAAEPNSSSNHGSSQAPERPSVGRLNPIQRRRQVSQNQSAVSQKRLENPIVKVQTFDVVSSNGSLPKIPTLQTSEAPEIMRTGISLPQLRCKTQRNHHSQVMEAWPSSPDSEQQSINIMTQQAEKVPLTARDEPQTLCKRDEMMGFNDSDLCEQDKQTTVASRMHPSGTKSIKVEVKNSKIFDPSASRVITDEEIRAARRIVVPNSARQRGLR